MPTPMNGGATHYTRVAMASALTKTKTEEEFRKQAETLVNDPTTAIKFLVDRDFKTEDNKMTFEFLGAIVMQISQQTRVSKYASEVFKAIAYLIINIQQKNMEAGVTDTIAKAVSEATKRVQNELLEATDQLVVVVAKTTKATQNLKTECQEAISKIKDTMEESNNTVKDNIL